MRRGQAASDHKLVGRGIGTRGWDEGPTRELIESLLKAP